MEFPIKNIECVTKLDPSALQKLFTDFQERRSKMRERLQKCPPDAPYFPEAVDLGPENMANAPIYKINVPGWFYRYHSSGSWTTKGATGMYLASEPRYLENDSRVQNRILYMTSTDGQNNDHANQQFPIYPGDSTYAYFIRDLSISDRSVTKSLMFVPAVIGTCMNIHPSDYVTKVGIYSGSNTIKSDQSTFVNNQVLASVFAGDWQNFKDWMKSMVGWFFTDESKIEICDSYKDTFKSDRIRILTELGIDPKHYGY